MSSSSALAMPGCARHSPHAGRVLGFSFSKRHPSTSAAATAVIPPGHCALSTGKGVMAEGLDEFPFRWIAQDLRRGRCIPFLGAGASAFPKDLHAKPPGARALALELAEESRYPAYQVAFEAAIPTDPTTNERILRAKVDCENLMLVSSWVEHGTGDRPRLRTKLRASLANEQQPLPCNSLHSLLARVAKQRPMAIMTTNYDDLIELALIERNAPFDLCVVAIDRPGTAAARR